MNYAIAWRCKRWLAASNQLLEEPPHGAHAKAKMPSCSGKVCRALRKMTRWQSVFYLLSGLLAVLGGVFVISGALVRSVASESLSLALLVSLMAMRWIGYLATEGAALAQAQRRSMGLLAEMVPDREQAAIWAHREILSVRQIIKDKRKRWEKWNERCFSFVMITVFGTFLAWLLGCFSSTGGVGLQAAFLLLPILLVLGAVTLFLMSVWPFYDIVFAAGPSLSDYERYESELGLALSGLEGFGFEEGVSQMFREKDGGSLEKGEESRGASEASDPILKAVE